MEGRAVVLGVLLVVVLCFSGIKADGGHGGHGGHGGGDHGMAPAVDLSVVGEQIHLVDCEHTAADGQSHYNLFPMLAFEDYTTNFKPYDRPVFINFCRDTVKPCDRNNLRTSESHPVCLPTDKGDLSLGQTTHSHGENHHHVDIFDSPLGVDKGVVLVYEGGDVCNETAKYQAKIHLVCKPFVGGDLTLVTCDEADWAPGDQCTMEVTCYSRCACPNNPECKNVLLRYGSDWNDWGHGFLGGLLILEGIIIIILEYGCIRGSKITALQKYPWVQAFWNSIVHYEEDKRTGSGIYKIDISMLESIGLVFAGTLFDLLTMKCCNIFGPPGSMHFLVGLCLMLLGGYGVLFGLSKRLSKKSWNFVMPTTLSFISLMLIQHEQGGEYMTMMHMYLAFALMGAAFFRALASFNKKFSILSAVSIMLAGSLLPGSSKSIVRFLEVQDVMPMTAVFMVFMIILLISLALVGLMLWKFPYTTPRDEEDDEEYRLLSGKK